MPHLNVVLLFLLLSADAFGQAVRSDSSFVRAARDQAVLAYERATIPQAHVFDGNEYIAHNFRIQGFPFYPLDSLQAGNVIYNGVYYRDLRMQYDVVRDELAIKPAESGFRVRLRSELVTAFSINTDRFVRFASPDDGGNAVGLTTGFYEMLYDGKTQVVSRRIKTINEDVSSGTYKANYVQKDRFYVLKDGAYHDVKSKRSVLGLFDGQTRELRKYIRANDLPFKGERHGSSIARIAQRYDELTR